MPRRKMQERTPEDLRAYVQKLKSAQEIIEQCAAEMDRFQLESVMTEVRGFERETLLQVSESADRIKRHVNRLVAEKR